MAFSRGQAGGGRGGRGSGGSRGGSRGGGGGFGGGRGGDRGRGGRGGDRGGRGGRGRGGAARSDKQEASQRLNKFDRNFTSGGPSEFRGRGGDRGGRGGDRGGRGGGRGRGSARGTLLPNPRMRNEEQREADRAQRKGKVYRQEQEFDIHLASKISQEFTTDINTFKGRLINFNFQTLDDLFRFVPPQFIQQHLPKEITGYRTYFSRFSKGSPNEVITFTKWMEWAFYEHNKGHGFDKNNQKHKDPATAVGTMPADNIDAQAERDEAEGDNAAEATSSKPRRTRDQLRTIADERQHMRALLQMCLRHNSHKRKEGQRALLNHFKEHVSELDKVRTVEELRDAAHHSVAYSLSRLLLGMAVDDASAIVFNTQALHQILTETTLHPRVVLSLIIEELALEARMKAMDLRMKHNKGGIVNVPDAELDPEFDPDEINDPTKGERNQRVAAGLFAAVAIVASGRQLAASDIRRLLQLLSFCYIEHKGTRILSANTMFMLMRRYGLDMLEDPEAFKWVSFAFFRFPKVEYFRPEAIQLLVILMNAEGKLSSMPENLQPFIEKDPLDPKVLEQLVNGLFRKEQVTASHPMIHPIWQDLVSIITARCAQGESLKAHVTNFVHVVIAPYRRGNVKVPRRHLFQKLIAMIGELALQNTDEDERMEVVNVASRVVGFGKQSVARPSDPALLRSMSVDEIAQKVMSLLRQLSLIRDNTPSATIQRTWALRELHGCVTVPISTGIDTPYVDAAVRQLLELGMYTPFKSNDETFKNRAIYLFADMVTHDFRGRFGQRIRPRTRVDAKELMDKYLAAEKQKKTRFQTALNNKSFKAARDALAEALDPSVQPSIMFYNNTEIRTLILLCFLAISVDDPTNEGAKEFAAETIPDLVRFYREGTIESIDIFYDVLMALILRPTAPLHVMPLMTCIRRIATRFLGKMARFIVKRETLDIVLAPIVDAYNTNDREIIRQMKAAKAEEQGKEDDEEDEEGSDTDSEASELGQEGRNKDDELSEDEGEEEEDEEEEDEEGDEATDKDEDTEADEDELEEEESVASSESDESEAEDQVDDKDGATSDADELESWADNAEEAPTQAYLDSLKRMVGDVDLGFAYPSDDASRAKADIVRIMTIATKVTMGLGGPLAVHTLQVLLAVLRNNVKVADPVIFEAALSNIRSLFMSPKRFFGSFVSVDELFQILGDIQSYCRKMERSLTHTGNRGKNESNEKAKMGALVRRRLGLVKNTALSALHYIGFLAYKNGASDDIRIAIEEHYMAIFFDKGWNEKRSFMQVKRDMFHFRHAFAWVFVPAVIEKLRRVQAMSGALRAKTFAGACKLISSFLPRTSGLPAPLKKSVGRAIGEFLNIMTPKEVYEMKHTAIYDLVFLVKMVVDYNGKLELNTAPLINIVNTIVDDDDIQVSRATVRKLGAIEYALGLTLRAVNTKPTVPVKVLYQQFEAKWRKDKVDFYRKVKGARRKTIKKLLAKRGNEATDEERAKKRRRREQLKAKDQVERAMMREERLANMTKEQKAERRKLMTMAKQERIAKNKERKRRLHEIRQKSFQRWREAKLAEADE